jgi:radical SAM/Cys-rich protein
MALVQIQDSEQAMLGAGKRAFDAKLAKHGLPHLARAASVTTLQINVGRQCNQACNHCHVEAGPKRTEVMTQATAERLMVLLEASPGVTTVDITGGAPELCPSFRYMVTESRRLGREVIVRHNLTIQFEEGFDDLATFFADHGATVVASMPCYSERNVDQQRGKGVFEKSIEGLQQLNALGYGKPGSGLVLDLVYNPNGAFLPPAQMALEADYKAKLFEDFGVQFNSLYTITNMPIKRFAGYLLKRRLYTDYMTLLDTSFNPTTVEGLMCRTQINIGWRGELYDCDFNQMLELDAAASFGGGPKTIWDLQTIDTLAETPIAVGSHCFGCTAGGGSSCGGALA